MKKGLSVLLAVMMMCSFTVSSWAAETSNEAPPTDMQECCEETMYAGGREVFTDNSGVMRVIEGKDIGAVSYTHLRAHETDSYLVCRLLLEKKKKNTMRRDKMR